MLIMKHISPKGTILAIAIMLATVSTAISAPKSAGAGKSLTVYGRVLQINRQVRTLLVADHWSNKLYLVSVPEGATFKIVFGLNMSVPRPELWQARKNDRVEMR